MRFITVALLLFAFSTSFTTALAQTSPYEALRLAVDDSQRLIAHQDLVSYVSQTLDNCSSKEEVMKVMKDWPFGGASAGSSKDWAIVLTWNSESFAREQLYGGFVIFSNNKSDNGWSYVELVHNAKEDVLDDGRSYRTDDWTGALYYQMILKYDGKTPVYTLLGWDGADGMVTRKVLETMSINNGRVRIGVPYIDNEKGLKKRHVLEYADVVQVTLKYEEENERIVLDRLAPSDPSLQGQTPFYGPTMEYDAYVWEDDKWVFTSDVEVKNTKNRKDKRPYNDPRPNRPRRK